MVGNTEARAVPFPSPPYCLLSYVISLSLSGPGLMAPANAFDRNSIEQGERDEDADGAVEGGADYA